MRKAGSRIFVDIKLKRQWMGHPKGQPLCVEEHLAQRLVKQGAARITDDEYLKQGKDKAVEAPPKDRMLRGAPATKSVFGGAEI